MTPTLETDRLILRPIGPDDLDAVTAFLVTDRGRWHGGGPDQGIGRAWRIAAILIGHWHIHGFGNFIARRKSDGRAVTSIGGFFPANWPEREIGWSTLDPDAEGQGYTTEAARAVAQHYRDDLKWPTAVSYIDPENTRSIALATKLGAWRNNAAPRDDANDLVFRHWPQRSAT